MTKGVKIISLILAVASIWFSFSFRSGRVILKVGTWERQIYQKQAVLTSEDHPIVVAGESSEGGDSSESDFA